MCFNNYNITCEIYIFGCLTYYVTVSVHIVASTFVNHLLFSSLTSQFYKHFGYHHYYFSIFSFMHFIFAIRHFQSFQILSHSHLYIASLTLFWVFLVSVDGSYIRSFCFSHFIFLNN